MKFSTTCQLWLLAHLCIVPALSLHPDIHWLIIKPQQRGNLLIYKAEPIVHLYCTGGRYWGPVAVVKANPVLPHAHVLTFTAGKLPNITLSLLYNASQFVDRIKVTCERPPFKRNYLIEQQYPTANVNITSANATVNAGSKVNVTCLADGKPSPKYQWYRQSTNGSSELVEGASQATFEVTTAEETSQVSFYQCRARNGFNKAGQWVNSSTWMSVTSTYIPTIITPITSPISNETSPPKLTYRQSNVTLNCSAPDASSDDISMKIDVEMVEGNPVLLQVRPEFIVKDDTMPVQVQILYDTDQFVPLVKVTCHAKNHKTGVIQSTSVQLIEQQYGTSNVVIQGLGERIVPSGDKVELTCLGDGNPEPYQYQWYNQTDVMAHETQRTLQFTAPTNWSSQSLLACGAKNRLSKAMVNSNPMKVTSVIPPQMAGSPFPSESTANNFVYKEVRKVNVTCSLPLTTIPDDVKLELVPVEDLLNPVAKDQLPKYRRHNNNTLLGIEYPSGVFLGRINVTCYVRNTISKEVLSSSEIQIEQLYQTMNAVIRDFSGDHMVEPGDEVTLHCLGDGNPRPHQYQWYNRTTAGDKPIDNQTEASLKFWAPTKWSGRSLFVCGVKNDLGKEFVKTGSVAVTSIFIPEPEFLSTPTASPNSTAEHLVFREVPNLTLTCSLPLAKIPGDVDLMISSKQYDFNPVYPSERAYVTQNKNQLEIHFNPDRFIGTVEVLCKAINRTSGKTKSSKLIQIDQQYKTMSVKLSSWEKSEVQAGEEVVLRCQGDGHPEPQVYEWYRRTQDGDVRMNVKTPFMTFVPRENDVIVCGTKNIYNTEGVVKSDPLTVSASPSFSTTREPYTSTTTQDAYTNTTSPGGAAITNAISWTLLVAVTLIGVCMN